MRGVLTVVGERRRYRNDRYHDYHPYFHYHSDVNDRYHDYHHYFHYHRDTVLHVQVIGLTASPGVGQGKTLAAAVTHIEQLCYIMDVERICTVEDNVEELRRYTNEPRHGQFSFPEDPRHSDGS